MNPVMSDIIQKTNEAITTWSKGCGKLVVALDGYTGIGKTTLLTSLATTNPDILPVNRDAFLFSRKDIEEKLSKAKDRSEVFEREVYDDKKLADLVTAFRTGDTSYQVSTRDEVSGEVNLSKNFDLSKKVMVIEGVFMFHPKSLNHLWDKRIYLEGDIDKIDARRVKREKQRWGKDYFPETHPDSYFRQVIMALKRYQETYHPEKVANLVLNVD